MKINNGKIEISEKDFKTLANKGYTIIKNSNEYTSFIGFEHNHLSFYFSGWNDNLKFFSECDTYLRQWKIKSENDLKNSLNLIESLIKVKNIGIT